jgi:hypothetical protein
MNSQELWELKRTAKDATREVSKDRIAKSLESIDKRMSHIEDWLGELVTYLKRK